MGRVATYCGIAAFLLTQVLALFGTWILASIRCCTAAANVGPQSASDWASIAIFAVVMLIPAGLVGIGTAIVVEAIAWGFRIATAERRSRRSGKDPT